VKRVDHFFKSACRGEYNSDKKFVKVVENIIVTTKLMKESIILINNNNNNKNDEVSLSKEAPCKQSNHWIAMETFWSCG